MMKRRSALGLGLAAISTLSIFGKSKYITTSGDKMKTVLHTADSRGHADHGWLNARHSFSFASYYDPSRMGFGMLRVLNDDTVAAGMGFGTHPHNDMEIVTIPLEGDLQHKDSLGNGTIIAQGEIQVMSAGTGIQHSEFNPNSDREVKLLQIWVKPEKKGVQPRYDQIPINSEGKLNTLNQIVSPNEDDEGVWVHQQAWFHLGDFDEDTELQFPVQGSNHGVYVFVIEGSAEVSGEKLGKRDAMGIWETASVDFKVASGSRVLAITVPMS